MRMAAKNYYEILGVDRSASTEEIKKAFRRVLQLKLYLEQKVLKLLSVHAG